jgi:hypothetical protein
MKTLMKPLVFDFLKITQLALDILCLVWNLHINYCENYYPLGYDTMYSGSQLPTFRRNLLAPSSKEKNTWNT